ncbi:MAG: flagellar export chaperone FlgN [Sedimentisphaerales bacterium]|nr:flagellar export chaperone FlgN [Sedimentisphaerales bacterium]
MANVFDPLLEAMSAELQAQHQLAVLLENKLDAMRRYDLSRLEALSATEPRVLSLVRSSAQKRTIAAKAATTALNPPRKSAVATAKELAAMAQGPVRERLEALTASLVSAAEKAQRLNQIHAAAARRVVGHLDHIFRLVAHAGKDAGLYSRGGKAAMLEQNRLVDAKA